MRSLELSSSCLEMLDETFFQQFLENWWDLFSHIDYATPFQSPAWIASWWKHFGNHDLRLFAYKVEGKLMGIAPLFIYIDPDGVRRLTFVASGISDYLDVLVHPNHEEDFVSHLILAIQSISSEWDVCDLQELRPDSPLLRFGKSHHHIGLLMQQSVCPALNLPESSVDKEKFYSTSNYKKILYYRRKFQKNSELTISSVTESSLTEYFESLFSLHAARWKEKGAEGVLQNSKIQDFHFEIGRSFYRKNILRMYALILNSRIAGIYYGFIWKKRAYFYLSGFDSSVRTLNPGSLLIGHAIDSAIAEGISEFDFLRGAENYKYQWGAINRINHRLIIENGTRESLQH